MDPLSLMMNPFFGGGYGGGFCGNPFGGGSLLEQILTLKLLEGGDGLGGLEDLFQGHSSKTDTRIHGNRVDLDGNGKFKKGRDGVLVLDFNKDGHIDDTDLQKSKEILSGFDDPWSVKSENREALKAFDSNGDGKLDSKELKAAHAQVWVDKDKDGERSRGEVFDADSVESGRIPQQIKSLDLETGNIQVEDKLEA